MSENGALKHEFYRGPSEFNFACHRTIFRSGPPAECQGCQRVAGGFPQGIVIDCYSPWFPMISYTLPLERPFSALRPKRQTRNALRIRADRCIAGSQVRDRRVVGRWPLVIQVRIMAEERYGLLSCISGWWFGTFYVFPYIGNHHPNWLICFRGIETTNQTCIWSYGT